LRIQWYTPIQRTVLSVSLTCSFHAFSKRGVSSAPPTRRGWLP